MPRCPCKQRFGTWRHWLRCLFHESHEVNQPVGTLLAAKYFWIKTMHISVMIVRVSAWCEFGNLRASKPSWFEEKTRQKCHNRPLTLDFTSVLHVARGSNDRRISRKLRHYIIGPWTLSTHSWKLHSLEKKENVEGFLRPPLLSASKRHQHK